MDDSDVDSARGPSYVYEPRMTDTKITYNFQRDLATRELPFQEKSSRQMGPFLELLNRVIRHPDKLNLYLSKTYGNPLQGRGPFQETEAPIPTQRSTSNYSFFGMRSPGFNPPTPATPSASGTTRPDTNVDRSHLVTAIKAAKLSFKPLDMAKDLLAKFIQRTDESPELRMTDPDSGLPQLAGFCFQVLKITTDAVESSNILHATSRIGLKIASDFLQDPLGLFNLMKGVIPRYTESTAEDSLSAKIKMRVAHDEAIAAYRRIGHSGFEGNWAGVEGHNPDIISAKEIEDFMLAMLNALMVLTTWTASLQDIFGILVFTDNIEKSYVLSHLRSMRIQDHIDIVLKIDELRRVNRKVNRSLLKIHNAADHIIYLLGPIRPRSTYEGLLQRLTIEHVPRTFSMDDDYDLSGTETFSTPRAMRYRMLPDGKTQQEIIPEWLINRNVDDGTFPSRRNATATTAKSIEEPKKKFSESEHLKRIMRDTDEALKKLEIASQILTGMSRCIREDADAKIVSANADNLEDEKDGSDDRCVGDCLQDEFQDCIQDCTQDGLGDCAQDEQDAFVQDGFGDCVEDEVGDCVHEEIWECDQIRLPIQPSQPE